jgi:hypothetical protein
MMCKNRFCLQHYSERVDMSQFLYAGEEDNE